MAKKVITLNKGIRWKDVWDKTEGIKDFIAENLDKYFYSRAKYEGYLQSNCVIKIEVVRKR